MNPEKRSIWSVRAVAVKGVAAWCCVWCGLAGTTSRVAAQQKSSNGIPSDGQMFKGRSAEELAQMVPPADPRDVASPEALVKALHESVNGPAGKWDEKRLLSLCLPHTVFAFPEADAHGVIRISVVSVEDIAREAQKMHETSSWYERTLVMHITKQDNIAVAYYNNDARTTSTGKQVERGVSICEMIFDGKRWWIASDIWDDIGTKPWPHDLDPAMQHSVQTK